MIYLPECLKGDDHGPAADNLRAGEEPAGLQHGDLPPHAQTRLQHVQDLLHQALGGLPGVRAWTRHVSYVSIFYNVTITCA